MPKIQVLPTEIAELIAAGEVVERPAAVIKELVENSIDAAATEITVDIKNGGILYMSVKDNGTGIMRADVRTAFLRHATSKIKQKDDLNAIGTLGFRGEALAAICAVSKTEVITRTSAENIGTAYVIEGGIEKSLDDVGCNVGTIITVRDLFYNTPARMKFLKKDVTEAQSIAAVISRIALSHPEIAFKFIKDGKQVLATLGDGSLHNTVYAVLGREFAMSLIDVNTETGGITVSGKICKPVYCKQNRTGQYFFLNGRLVRSGTAMAALEQAYKNSLMVGKYPCCVLNITVPFNTVDVNVHPTKMEVRFSDEKAVFSAVYYAVKNALESGDTRPELKIKQTFNPYALANGEKYETAPIAAYNKPTENTVTHIPAAEYKKQTFENGNMEFHSPTAYVKNSSGNFEPFNPNKPPENKAYAVKPSEPSANKAPAPYRAENIESVTAPQSETEYTPVATKEVRYIGYAFSTYIIAEYGEDVYFIDKHAAHERMLFEELKKSKNTNVQQLLTPAVVELNNEEFSAVMSSTDLLYEYGFEVEEFGTSSVAVRTVPAILKNEDIPLLISEIAGKLMANSGVSVDRLDDILHTVACKAAIKGGMYNSDFELKALAQKILTNNDIMYCPHGRPVAFKISRKELEKQFGRLQ